MSDCVNRWLEEIGLGEHAESFVENDIDFDLLTRLSTEELKELGLSVGHRRRFLDAVAKLREAGSEGAGISRHSAPHGAAERRQLTVMFCDLVGSTELSQKLDAEDLREINRAYQDACKAAIERYDGYVARYMGDGVLAYFGYPQAHEDDAERAVRAGLGIVGAIDELNAGVGRRYAVELAVRVGISTGPVVVGDLIGEGASQESAVVGETPNLAARLQSVAKNNNVVISPSTHRITAAHFEYRDLGGQVLTRHITSTARCIQSSYSLSMPPVSLAETATSTSWRSWPGSLASPIRCTLKTFRCSRLCFRFQPTDGTDHSRWMPSSKESKRWQHWCGSSRVSPISSRYCA